MLDIWYPREFIFVHLSYFHLVSVIVVLQSSFPDMIDNSILAYIPISNRSYIFTIYFQYLPLYANLKSLFRNYLLLQRMCSWTFLWKGWATKVLEALFPFRINMGDFHHSKLWHILGSILICSKPEQSFWINLSRCDNHYTSPIVYTDLVILTRIVLAWISFDKN